MMKSQSDGAESLFQDMQNKTQKNFIEKRVLSIAFEGTGTAGTTLAVSYIHNQSTF